MIICFYRLAIILQWELTDAIKAVELANPKIAIPMHYNTFPVINSDPNEFKKLLEGKAKNVYSYEFW